MLQVNPEEWKWEEFFGHSGTFSGWGGPEWIRGNLSAARLREFRPGDVVVCFECAPTKAIVGFGEIASMCYDDEATKDADRPGLLFDLAHPVRARSPIPLSILRGDSILRGLEKCVIGQLQANTVLLVTDRQLRRIVQLAQPTERLRAGPSEAPADDGEPPQQPGGGRADILTAEERRAIELHAMAAARRHYESCGYDVSDCSASRPFDLLCRQRRRTLFVEVKGTMTSGESVILTSNEVEHARSHAADSALAVLRDINLAPSGAASGGTLEIIEPWRVDPKALRPTQFEYALHKPRRPR